MAVGDGDECFDKYRGNGAGTRDDVQGIGSYGTNLRER